MPRILFPEFRDQFEATKYPFAAQATLRNELGDVIPEETFFDAHLYPIGSEERLYLTKVEVDHAAVTLYVGDLYEEERCSGSYDPSDPPSKLALYDNYDRPAGIFVTEPYRIAVFQSWGIGIHRFEVGQTEFAATCCMPQPAVGVRGIQLEDGTLVTGRAWILGDDGVVVRYEAVPRESDCRGSFDPLSVIRVDIVGDPLYRRRLCEPDLFETPNPIRKLRFVDENQAVECEGNEYGNITIMGNDDMAADAALRVRQTREGLVVEMAGSNNMLGTINQ